jgi:hypothetical protein
MLPANEYAYLKKKYEAEQAAIAAKARQQSYDAAAFAHAMHGMSSPPIYPARKDSYFRMKPGKAARPQPTYKSKQKCAPVCAPPKPKPEYSSPQVRKDYRYKTQGLNGKAGEILGLTNKPMYTGKNKPLPKVPVKQKKMKKPIVHNATKPLPKLPKDGRKPKKSTGCIVM